MSCTKSSATKVSPVGGGINKSLLTPCRRIGLSKKRKTPNSILKILSADLNSSSDCSFETTPINHRKTLRKKSELLDFQTPPSVNSQPAEDPHLEIKNIRKEKSTDNNSAEKASSKKDLSKIFSFEDIFDSDNSPMKVEKEESLMIVGENDNVLFDPQNDSELFMNEPVNSVHYIDNISDSMLENNLGKSLTKIISSSDLLDTKHSSVRDEPNTQENTEALDCKNEVVVVSDFEEDFKTISKCRGKKKQHEIERKSIKRIRKTLSIKKSLSTTDDEFDPNSEKISNNVKECKVQLQKLSNAKVNLNKNTSVKSFEKSVEDPFVLDDDDAFTSTPEQEKSKRKEMIQKIKMLESQVKQKRQRLENLKQASIYKSKHNIESLKQLTSKWSSGSVLGLNDLLNQLQAHGPINMSTLLSNLHIPSEIVSKLPFNVE